MNLGQRIGLLLFLLGAFARIEYFIKAMDDPTALNIFSITIAIGFSLFFISDQREKE